MKIYIAHSRNFDYQAELYDPIRSDSRLPQSDIILPHDLGHNPEHGREFYADLTLVIAEVSYQSTGLGIEIGWAFDNQVPIYCLYRQDHHPSRSLHAVTDKFYSYAAQSDMLQIIQQIINHAQAGSCKSRS